MTAGRPSTAQPPSTEARAQRVWPLSAAAATETAPAWRVVIIDDSPDDRAEVRRLLLMGSGRRYKLAEAETGEAGVRLVLDPAEEVPDCVVLDYYLPDMDGVEVLEALTGPDGACVCPVVVLTGDAEAEIGRTVLRAGAQDYIGKDWLTAQGMTRAIENAVERHLMARELSARGAALRETEERLRLAQQAAHAGIWEVDLDTGWFVADDVALRLHLLPPGTSMTHEAALAAIHPDDRATAEAALRRAREDGTPFRVEVRVVHPDGSTRWLLSQAGRRHGAATSRLIGLVQDITAQKEAEAELRTRHAHAEAVARTVARLVLRDFGGTYDLATEIFADVAPVFGAELYFNYLVGPEPDTLRLVSSAGLPEAERERFARIRFGEYLCGTVAATRRPLVVADLGATAFEPALGLKASGVRAYAGFPLLAGGELLGTIAFATARRPAFSADEVTLMQTVTDLLAAALWQNRMAAALAADEERLRLAVEASATGLWTWDLETDTVTWSPECYHIHGVAAGAFDGTGAGFFRLVHPDDRERVEGTVRHAIDSRVLYECQFRVVRPGGEVAWVTNRGRCSYAAGRPLRVLGTIIDISDRKRVEDELQASEEYLRTALSASRAGAWGWDVRTGAITWSPENYALYGLDPAGGPPAYSDWEKTIHPDDLAGATTAIRDALTGRTPEFRAECRVLHPTRGTCWLLGLGRVERDQAGEPVRMIGINLDITERKQFEATLADQDRRKDEFLATLAHELRNPLAPIRNGLELLRVDPHGDTAAETRAMMERQLAHLVRLVDDLLDVSRVSRGTIELKREPVPLRAVLDHALEASRPLLEAAGHELEFAPPDPPVWLDGDLTRLAQVVSNLLNNAAKYTPDRGRVTLSTGVEGGQAFVRVADNGTGISADMLPRVFELFAQVDRTLDRAQGGLGIGLSLVKKLVEMHGGTITAESRGVGLGSAFTVRLPVASPPAIPDAPAASPQMGARSSAGAPLRILVVDDSEDSARSLAMLLKVWRHATRVAHDGPSAIETAAEFRPELVFLDIGLPAMDGHEVCCRLRANPDLAGTTFVALTGWGSEADKNRARDAGFAHHLVKPVDPDQIVAILKALTERRERAASAPAE